MSLIADIDARLARLACDLIVQDGAQAMPGLKRELETIAVQLVQDGGPGMGELAQIIRRAASIATVADIQMTLQIADAAWTEWKSVHGDPETRDVIQLDANQDIAAPRRSTPPQPAPEPAATRQARDVVPALDLDTPTPQVMAALVEADVEALAVDRELSGMFIAEALDHLSSIEATVLALENAPSDNKLLNDVFRPFHTVKGNSGALGVTTVQELAHKVENLLDLCRAGKHVVGAAEIDVILQSVDLLTTMITDLGDRLAGQPGIDTSARRTALMALVDGVIEGRAMSDATAGVAPAADAAANADAADSVAMNRRHDDGQASVKVDTRKLDSLVDMVGELVIVQTIIAEDPRLHSAIDERLTRNLAQLKRITGDLQRNAMALRMVPVRQTFQKMARLVRDLSKKSGKPIELVLSGEDTELDRKMVEEINDPLMHMVRNSVDHGIEDPQTRTKRNKRPQGRLSLSAFHQSGSIVIEIADDGGGLDTEKILAKAVQRGLVAPDATPTPDEIFHLIFAPGFSTADKVTEISGRGVGMDVVRRNIESLRGRVEIQSTLGQGATFSIRLPLTLAILDGLVLRVGSERFVLPTFSIRESLRPDKGQVHSVYGEPCMVRVRDELIPLISLAELLGVGDARVVNAWEGTVIVIEDEGRRGALLVDELVGKQEVVVKALGDTFEKVMGVSGGAILGDGRIGLILDGGTIVKMMRGEVARAA